MILFTILLATVFVIAAIALIATILVGGSFIVVFGDALVFALIVMLIVKLVTKKK